MARCPVVTRRPVADRGGSTPSLAAMLNLIFFRDVSGRVHLGLAKRARRKPIAAAPRR